MCKRKTSNVTQEKKCWLGNIKQILTESLGLPEIWNNLGTRLTGKHLGIINTTLKSVYKFQWEKYINRTDNGPMGGNKLRTYRKFKNVFMTENYLSYMTNNTARKYFARLRTSAHSLRIETGRHTVPKTPVDARLCRHCNKIDDEFHFLLECSKSPDSVTARRTFLNQMTTLYPDFTNMTKSDQFIFIMAADNEDKCMLLQSFIMSLVRNRGSL